MYMNAFLLNEALEIQWHTGETSHYSYFWLRDNARDAASFDHRTHQRRRTLSEIEPQIQPLSATLAADGQAIHLHWPTGGIVTYEADFLYRYKHPQTPAITRPEPRLWQTSPSHTPLHFSALEQAPTRLPLALGQFGFALITGCPPSKDGVQQIVSQLGYVRHSIFGGIWTFEADAAMQDSAYSAGYLHPHTDGTYCLDPPGAQILLCVEKNGTGGASILVDGFAVAEALKTHHPHDYATLCETAIEACYCGDGVQLKAQHPVFREQHGRLTQVCFNNYDREVMRLDDTRMTALYHSLRRFEQTVNDPQWQWHYTLQAGDALVFDNWRVLHGRTDYSGGRRLTGCYLNHEDIESRWRML